MLKFEYELYFVPDGKFGAENQTTHEWNGLVREIIDKVCVWVFRMPMVLGEVIVSWAKASIPKADEFSAVLFFLSLVGSFSTLSSLPVWAHICN